MFAKKNAASNNSVPARERVRRTRVKLKKYISSVNWSDSNKRRARAEYSQALKEPKGSVNRVTVAANLRSAKVIGPSNVKSRKRLAKIGKKPVSKARFRKAVRDAGRALRRSPKPSTLATAAASAKPEAKKNLTAKKVQKGTPFRYAKALNIRSARRDAKAVGTPRKPTNSVARSHGEKSPLYFNRSATKVGASKGGISVGGKNYQASGGPKAGAKYTFYKLKKGKLTKIDKQ